MTKISIIIPTVSGREDFLARCVESYKQNTETHHEFVVVRDRPTCGQAILEGEKLATGDVVHTTADDLEAHPAWDLPALEALEEGCVPAPVLMNPDGSLQGAGGDLSLPDHVHRTLLPDWSYVDYAGLPFINRSDWRKIDMRHLHYFADVWYSYVLRELYGIQTVLRHGYRFTHHYAQAGRQNDTGDHLLFYQWLTEKLGGPPSHPPLKGTAR